MSKLWQKWNGHLFIGLLVFGFVFLLSGCGTEDKPDYAAMNGQEAVIDYTKVSPLRLMTEQSFMMMTEQYIVASMATEKAARLKETDDPTAINITIFEMGKAWREFDEIKAHTLMLCELLQKVEEKEKKTALLFPVDGFFSRAQAAHASAGAFQEQIQKGYEASYGHTYADITKNMGNAESDLVKQVIRDHDAANPTAGFMKDMKNVKTASMIGAGIVMVPVGLAVGMVGAGNALAAGGTAAAIKGGIGIVSAIAGATSTTFGIAETMVEAKGGKLEGAAKTMKNTIDAISVFSAAGNVMFSVYDAGSSALKGLAGSGNKISMKDLVNMTAEEFLKNQSTTEKILLINDANGAKEFIEGLKAKGMDVTVSTNEAGQPCLVVKKKEELQQPETKTVNELSDADLKTEIEAREKRIRDAKAQMNTILDESLDWEYKNSVGMTRAEYYKKCEELEKKIEKAQEEYFKAADADDGSSPTLHEEKEKARKKLHQAYQDWLDFTKPHSDYVNSQAYKDEAKRREDDFAKAEEDFEKAVQESADLNQKQAKNEQAKKIQESIANDKNAGNQTYPASSVAGTYMGTGAFRSSDSSESWQESVVVSANGENSLRFTFHDSIHADNPDWTCDVAYDPVNGVGEIEGFPFRFTKKGGQYIFNWEHVVNVEDVHQSIKFGE